MRVDTKLVILLVLCTLLVATIYTSSTTDVKAKPKLPTRSKTVCHFTRDKTEGQCCYSEGDGKGTITDYCADCFYNQGLDEWYACTDYVAQPGPPGGTLPPPSQPPQSVQPPPIQPPKSLLPPSTQQICPDGSAPDANGNCPTSTTNNQQIAPPSEHHHKGSNNLLGGQELTSTTKKGKSNNNNSSSFVP